MKSCWYEAVAGTYPKAEDCKRLHPNGCDGCSYFLPDPPDGDGEQDEMPDCSLLEAKMEERQVPPLGLKPKWIHDGQRIREIFEAMERYSDAEKPIPREWIDELRELVASK